MFLFYILNHLCIPLSSHSFIIYTKITLSRLFPNTFLVLEYKLVLCAKILQLFSWLLLQIDFRMIGQFLKLKVHYFCTRGHQNLQTLLTTHYSFLFSQQATQSLSVYRPPSFAIYHGYVICAKERQEIVVFIFLSLKLIYFPTSLSD